VPRALAPLPSRQFRVFVSAAAVEGEPFTEPCDNLAWRSLKEVPGLIHLGEENRLGGDGEAVDREWRLAMASVPGRIRRCFAPFGGAGSKTPNVATRHSNDPLSVTLWRRMAATLARDPRGL
jgi:hypothetical protein